MPPKSKQAARRAKAKAKSAAETTEWTPFTELDNKPEPDAQAVRSAMALFEAMPEGSAKCVLREWASLFHEVGCYTRDKSLVGAVANMEDLSRPPSAAHAHLLLPQGEARRTFRMMPDGQCKSFVREYAEQLQRAGRPVEDAMQEAQRQSLEDYPETWVIVRGLQGRPWDANDIALALRSAEVAVQLRQALTNAVHGDEQRPTSTVEKGAGKGFTAFHGA
jgi:hypothetical protein